MTSKPRSTEKDSVSEYSVLSISSIMTFLRSLSPACNATCTPPRLFSLCRMPAHACAATVLLQDPPVSFHSAACQHLHAHRKQASCAPLKKAG